MLPEEHQKSIPPMDNTRKSKLIKDFNGKNESLAKVTVSFLSINTKHLLSSGSILTDDWDIFEGK